MGNTITQYQDSLESRKELLSKHLNPNNLNRKYQFKPRVYKQTQHSKTIQVFDMMFKVPRVLRQVLITSTPGR